jgi:predicted enzyme related to lactoylglutathione lyase
MKISKGMCATVLSALVFLTTAFHSALAQSSSDAGFAVGPQYDTAHDYVAPGDFDRFISSVVETFGGTSSTKGAFTVTPTPSKTFSQLALTTAGTISVFGFTTPIPYPFGLERTGYLVTDIDAATASAKAHGAAVVVAKFDDPLGKDVVIEWPGGVLMQLYWHTSAPHYAPLATVPENRIYVSPDSADEFIRDFVAFSHGEVESDVRDAPGIEIGSAGTSYRRVRIQSPFGQMLVLVTNGFLPYPYGRETTGYAVPNLATALAKATAAGSTVLVPAFSSGNRQSAMVAFPGGIIAEIHSGQDR